MPGKHYDNMGPKKRGPYMMKPGQNSKINPGNFRGEEVMKYHAMKMHPMKFPDLSGDGKVTQKDILMGRGVIDKPNNYKRGYPEMEIKPKNAVDGKSHDDLKAAGGKAFDIHMRDHNKGVFPKMYGKPKAHHSKKYAEKKTLKYNKQQKKKVIAEES